MAPHPIEEVLAALNAEEVRYLVVGGVAVVLHGHLRTTADLDLVVALSGENARGRIAVADRKPAAAEESPRRGPAARPSPLLAGLRMTPAERLRWLQETMETLRRWQGRARSPTER